MSERIKTFFRYNSIMHEFNSAEIGHRLSFSFRFFFKCNNNTDRGIYQFNIKIKIPGGYNTLPSPGNFEFTQIYCYPRNLFAQAINSPVNIILIIGKMNDCNVATASWVSKLYASNVNFLDYCARIWSSMGGVGASSAGKWDGHARGWEVSAGRWDGHARGWDCEARQWIFNTKMSAAASKY